MLISKFFTIGVSFVNELEEPFPIVILIGVCIVNYFAGFLFPTKEELDQITKEAQEIQEAEIKKLSGVFTPDEGIEETPKGKPLAI